MATLNYKLAYQVFFEAHKGYFEAHDPEIRGISWRSAYSVHAKEVYAGLTKAEKAAYYNGVPKADFMFEPPTAGNLRRGRNQVDSVMEIIRARAEAGETALPPDIAALATPAAPPDADDDDGEDEDEEDSADKPTGAIDHGGAEEGGDGEGPASGPSGTSGKGGASQKAPGKRPAEEEAGNRSPVRRRLETQSITDFPNDPGNTDDHIDLPNFTISTPGQGVKYLYGDLNYTEELAADYLKSAPGPQEHWKWERDQTLGIGTYGIATRWILVDGEGNEQDRIVCKDISLVREWTDITAWSDDARATPREVAVHRILNPATKDEAGSEYFIIYRGSRLNKALKFVRIGMQEARLKDLDVLTRGLNPGEMGDKSDPDDIIPPLFRQHDPEAAEADQIKDFTDERYEYLPARFIWELAAALIAGMKHMHKQEIVHRDFKPPNIFVDVVDDDKLLKGWKLRPLIADYGTCMPFFPTRYQNPEDFDGLCTLGYNAPEQWRGYPPAILRRDGSERPFPIREKADVLALGWTIFQVMFCMDVPYNTVPQTTKGGNKKKKGGKKSEKKRDRDQGIKRLYGDDGPRKEPRNHEQYVNDYIEIYGEKNWFYRPLWDYWHEHCAELIDMIKRCLLWNPDSRPTLDELSDMVAKHLLAEDEAADIELSDFFDYLSPRAPAETGKSKGKEKARK